MNRARAASFASPPKYRGKSRQGRFIRGLPGTGGGHLALRRATAAKSRRSGRNHVAKRAHEISAVAPNCAKHLSHPGRTRVGEGREHEVVMEKERARGGGAGEEVRQGGSMGCALSPCQECNSHAVGIPSRSAAFAVRLLLRAPDAFLRRERRSPFTTAARTNLGPPFPPTCAGRESTARFTTARLNTARDAAKAQVGFHLLGFRLSLSGLARNPAARGRVSRRRSRASYGTRSTDTARAGFRSRPGILMYSRAIVKYGVRNARQDEPRK